MVPVDQQVVADLEGGFEGGVLPEAGFGDGHEDRIDRCGFALHEIPQLVEELGETRVIRVPLVVVEVMGAERPLFTSSTRFRR